MISILLGAVFGIIEWESSHKSKIRKNQDASGATSLVLLRRLRHGSRPGRDKFRCAPPKSHFETGSSRRSKLGAAGWVRADDLLKMDSIEHMISQPEFGAMQVFTGAQDKGFTHL